MAEGKRKTGIDIIGDAPWGMHFCQFLVTTSPIFNDKGELIGSVHIAKDITLIKDKEKELAKKMSDLKTFNKVAVDRELKMEELKKKIKELEAKLITRIKTRIYTDILRIRK